MESENKQFTLTLSLSLSYFVCVVFNRNKDPDGIQLHVHHTILTNGTIFYLGKRIKILWMRILNLFFSFLLSRRTCESNVRTHFGEQMKSSRDISLVLISIFFCSLLVLLWQNCIKAISGIYLYVTHIYIKKIVIHFKASTFDTITYMAKRSPTIYLGIKMLSCS